jgi:phage shock protein PspC (stress-responsive transcriptional regulator)
MNSSTEDPRYSDQPDETEPPQGTGAASRPPLRRPARGRMVAGVAAGISEHFNIDVTIVRVAFAVLTVVGFTGLAFVGGLPLYLGGIPLYLGCWLLIPEEGSDHSIAGRLFADRQQRRAS